MQPRTLAFMAVGVFAFCNSFAMAQGREGGYQDGGHAGSAGAYHGGGYASGPGHYGGWGGYRGAYGYRGWYGPNVGVFVGVPWYAGSLGLWGNPYYPDAIYGGYPAGTSPYPAYARAATQSYIEQAPPPSGYWYYCADPAGYYPYIQECNQAWVPVTPQNVPPGQ